MKRSLMVGGRGIPPGRVLAPANRHDSPLLAPTLDKLEDIGPLPDDITVHLDAGYDSQKTRDELAGRGMTGDIAHKGEKARSRPGSAGTSSGPTPGTTTSTGSNAAANGARKSSTRSSTSPMPSSQSVGSSARHGPSTGGSAARPGVHDHPPIRAVSYPEKVPTVAVDYMSLLVKVDPALFARYSRRGQTTQYHRGADLRQHRLQAHVPRAPT
jgi:hypothetical protein